MANAREQCNARCRLPYLHDPRCYFGRPGCARLAHDLFDHDCRALVDIVEAKETSNPHRNAVPHPRGFERRRALHARHCAVRTG